ncbi:hypothetical protein [Burkholderia contaminans]|nr:hypothetical protein [Burkholderia contaminans]
MNARQGRPPVLARAAIPIPKRTVQRIQRSNDDYLEKKMTDISKQVMDLNAGWYNVVRQALNLDENTFQLAQGTLALASTDSSGLFLISNAVPPVSAVAHYDASGLSSRASAYDMLLHALRGEGGNTLQTALGDQYAKWIAYRDADTSSLTQLQLFQKWADRHLDPNKAAAAVTVFKQQATLPLNVALDAVANASNRQSFVDSAGNPYSLYKYSATLDEAQQAIANGASADIAFDSQSMNTSLSHVWVEGAASGFYDIFSAGARGSFDQLNTKAASSRLSIEGHIGSFATLATQPGAWFTSSEFSRAYSAKNDNTVWTPGASAGNWDSFFSQPNGSLARRVSQLVLVSDYKISVTSHASYSASDQQTITAAAEFGIWPFFSASAKSSVTTGTTINNDGSLTVTYTLNKGLVQIWGVTVQNAPN